MQLYDFIFLAFLAISCFAGVMRGGVKELVNLIAFFLAMMVAVVSKGYIVKAFHLGIITGYVTAFILFVLIYFAIRYLGHALSDKVQKQKALGAFDRVLGFAVGFVRTLVVLGVFHLIFSAVTPIERQPHWFRAAKIYPLGAKCAKLIQAFIPAGSGMAEKVAANNE
ncbi:CvpA family protein [Asticcacaulis sp. EMRT-3]|uniref:CvpA family protein n=1 Tax=Asticcacaulis sp. EMRT-3 TaxID=3040349 RepID=UPI0024AF2841|nr:CvpA family protein [Asticcacaulis sp. EMRT-3]MDI7774642.1 CvpA family protein [Asticcacaulis sp. EMRT-3]